MKRIFTASLLAAASAAGAADLNHVGDLNQHQFRQLSEDLGAALSYKGLTPAEPLGITGFDLGVEATSTTPANGEAVKLATGSSQGSIVVPKIHLHKGLPAGLDVGAFFGASTSISNMNLVGAELRYAILEGGIATPALGLRGTWSRMGGVDQMDLTTKGLELTVSKGFAMATPYAGVGNVWIDGDPKVAGLTKESFTETKYFVGLNFNLGLTNLAFEGDDTGGATSFGAKLGFRW